MKENGKKRESYRLRNSLCNGVGGSMTHETVSGSKRREVKVVELRFIAFFCVEPVRPFLRRRRASANVGHDEQPYAVLREVRNTETASK
jgi:hypothetical protein